MLTHRLGLRWRWRAFRLMIILRPSAVRHKFRDDVIIPGGRPEWPPLRSHTGDEGKSSKEQLKLGRVFDRL